MTGYLKIIVFLGFSIAMFFIGIFMGKKCKCSNSRKGGENETLVEVLRNTAGGLIVIDNAGNVLSLNQEAEQMLGMSGKEIIGNSLMDKVKEHCVVNVAQRQEGDMQVFSAGTNAQTKQIMRQTTAVIEDSKGNTIGLAMGLRDVIKHQQLDLIKDNLISHIAHELKAPLISIETSIKMVLDDKDNIDLQLVNFLELAVRNTKRLRGILGDAMDAKGLSRGQVKLNIQNISYEMFINNLFCLIIPWAKEKGISLTKEGNESIALMGDEEWLHKAIFNVLGNSLKFTQPGGRVTVKSSYDTDWLTIKISDDGAGISENQTARIFGLFEQSDSKPAEGSASGIGLGLAVTKQVIDLHGGKITVESKVGKGSVFSITLPLKKYDKNLES